MAAGSDAAALEEAQAEIASLRAEVEKLRAALPKDVVTTTPLWHDIGSIHIKEFQYEELVLAGVCTFMLIVWLIPLVRPFRHCCETKLHKVYPVLTVFNLALLMVSLQRLYLISLNEVFFGFVTLVEKALSIAEKGLIGMSGLFALAVVWKFKDRVFEFLGVENAAALFGDFRDWATCWSMKRFHPIELFLWKVEGLPSARLHSSNDVFCEVSLGYNVTMKTRVHHGAGHSCVFKETVQLNFDPYDSDHRLTVAMKSQDVVGATDLAQVQLGAEQVRRLEEPVGNDDLRTIGWGSKVDASAWAPSHFTSLDLVPAGRVWLRIVPAESEASDGGFFSSCFRGQRTTSRAAAMTGRAEA